MSTWVAAVRANLIQRRKRGLWSANPVSLGSFKVRWFCKPIVIFPPVVSSQINSALNPQCLAWGHQARCDPSEVIYHTARDIFKAWSRIWHLLQTASFQGNLLDGQRAVWPARIFMRRDLVPSSALTHGLSSALLASTSGAHSTSPAGTSGVSAAPETRSSSVRYFKWIQLSFQSPSTHTLGAEGNKFRMFLKSTCVPPCF